MSEPVRISINLELLEHWLSELDGITRPSVIYGKDIERMKDDVIAMDYHIAAAMRTQIGLIISGKPLAPTSPEEEG